MAPIPLEYQYDFWNQVSTDDTVELTCLMPNGIIILLNVNYNATLAEIKEDLWEDASKFPLYGKLHDMSDYIFKIINYMGEEEELNDEFRRLCDIRPTCAVFIVTECRENSADHTLNVAIGQLIGKSLQEFDALNSSEINDFRFKMRKMGDEIVNERNKITWLEKLYYQFPPRITTDSYILTETIKEKKNLKIATKFEYEYEYPESKNNEKEVMQSSFTFNVQPQILPNQLLGLIMAKRANLLNHPHEQVQDFVLKVIGQDEYLIGDNQLIEFQYIQDCISKEITPTLLVLHVQRVPLEKSNDYAFLDSFDKKSRTASHNSSNTLRKKKNFKSSWSILEKFSVTIATASKLNCDTKKAIEIGIQAGLFHGGRPLCQPVKTEELPLSENSEVAFNVDLEFDIQLCNIPRNAKLCFVVYELNKYVKGTKSRRQKDIKENFINPIAWANTSVYDFKGQLKMGAMSLYMWTYAEDMLSDEVLHPLGTVVNNPNTDYCTALTLSFKSYEKDKIIKFPDLEAVIQYARQHESYPEIIKECIENCKKLLEMDNLYDMHDQDRKNIWSLKRYWMDYAPEVLPKLISCVEWDKKEEVCEIIALLKEWPKLPVEKSLELLDYAYADQEVRNFAVQCLTSVRFGALVNYVFTGNWNQKNSC